MNQLATKSPFATACYDQANRTLELLQAVHGQYVMTEADVCAILRYGNASFFSVAMSLRILMNNDSYQLDLNLTLEEQGTCNLCDSNVLKLALRCGFIESKDIHMALMAKYEPTHLDPAPDYFYEQFFHDVIVNGDIAPTFPRIQALNEFLRAKPDLLEGICSSYPPNIATAYFMAHFPYESYEIFTASPSQYGTSPLRRIFCLQTEQQAVSLFGMPGFDVRYVEPVIKKWAVDKHKYFEKLYLLLPSNVRVMSFAQTMLKSEDPTLLIAAYHIWGDASFVLVNTIVTNVVDEILNENGCVEVRCPLLFGWFIFSSFAGVYKSARNDGCAILEGLASLGAAFLAERNFQSSTIGGRRK